MRKRGRRWTFFIAAVMAASCLLGMVPVMAQSYVHEQGFASEHEMTGVASSFIESFQMGDWEYQDAKLTLCFAVTPLVRYEVSDFTVSLNGRSVYSMRIPLTEGQMQQVEIPLPVDALQAGNNELKLESYIRTNESEPCSDDISQATWMTVAADSSVAVTYSPTATCENVADCYEQLTSLDALENHQSAVFVPQTADAQELTAAAYVLTGIAGNAALYYDAIDWERATAESALRAKKYSVYIGRCDSLLPSVRERLSAEQIAAAQQGAIVALVSLGADCNVLVVAGDDEAALINAGRLFGNADYMRQTIAAWREVSAKETVTFAWEQANAVRQITQTGSYVNGPFRQSVDFYIENTPNHALDVNSKLDLVFRYSENLDFDRSLVTVYLNDTPIGSKKLSKDLAQGDTASLAFPADLDIVGNFTLGVAFDLEIPDMWCTIRQDEMPWAYVSDQSTLELNTSCVSDLLYEYYPYPFVSEGCLSNVVALLPDQPGDADLDALRGVLLTLGRFQKDNTGSLRVAYASDKGDLSQANMIAIGRLENNLVAQQYNEQLYFQFDTEGTTICSNEKLLIEPEYGATLGTAQLLASPYSTENRALLLLSGVTDEGMLYAAKYFSQEENIWTLYGDGFVADADAIHQYRFKNENQKDQTSQAIQTNAWVLATVGGGVLMLLVLATIFLWRKYRRESE